MDASHSQHEHARRPHLVDSDAAALNDIVREAQTAKPLSGAEQDRLLHQAALGDRVSQERLVAAHLDLVIRLAEARGEQSLSMPDLVQDGSIGLAQAVRYYMESGEGDFVRFAEQRINAQMDAAIATEAAAVRDAELLVAAATDYERTDVAMRLELHREPTADELAEKLEWTVQRTRYVAQVVADARRRLDEEMLEFIDPEAIDFDGDERPRI
ncbi:MAG TPA: sigma factor [Candidatus Dormibacteraeota bacterium]|nr:sigma factor [Candidatus Dormibacteraeota bacterium]